MQELTIEGYGLSPQQRHLWRLRDEDEPAVDYHAGLWLGVEGTLATGAFVGALRTLFARHEILRTSFQLLPGARVPVQVIRSARAADVHELDLTDLAPERQEREMAERAARLGAEPFDPAGGETLRALLMRRAPERAVIYLCQPALCGDVASLWNLARELARELEGASRPGDEPIQFADVAQWQHELFDSEDAQPGLEHWRATLRRVSSDGRLPFERSSSRPFRPVETVQPLPDDLAAAVARCADELGVDTTAVLASAWHAYLFRQRQAGGFAVATACPGRAYEGLDVAIGPFQKLLPIALDPRGETTFAKLARAEHAARGLAEEWHEYWDSERLAADSRGARYGFAHHGPVEELRAGRTLLRCLGRPSCVERLPLVLVCDETGSSFDLRIVHDPAAFGPAEVRTVAEQYATLLASACSAPSARLPELDLLGETERARLDGPFAETGPAPAADACIHDLIREQAAARPEAIAVTAEGVDLTYAELERRSNRLAHHLRSLGVGPDVFVGIFADRCVEAIVAILGALKAGGAYLPLPPSYPEDRVAFMLKDAGAAVVVTREADADRLPAHGGRTVVLERDRAAIDARDGTAPATGVGLDALAYAIYTSGSSGRPKGVPIPHANLVRSTRTRMQHYGRPVRSYLLLSSTAFDSSVAGIFWTLAQGGRLVLPPEGFERELDRLPELVARHRISHLLGLPSLWSALLAQASAGALGSLETVIVAGEACSTDLVRRHFETLPRTALSNEYGPTEATVWTTAFDCAELDGRERVPIGRPIPGARVRVLDAGSRPVAIGLPGEIHIGGAGLAPGYVDRPDLDEEKFVPDPVVDGGRLYRTGDLGRFLPDGNLDFLGRTDNQVKVRGFRIELEEIEAVLAGHEDVSEAVVVAIDGPAGDKRLVAYVLPGPRQPDVAALKAHLARSLPEHMVPSGFVILAELPRLPNGKLDRRSLPDPDAAESSRSHREPATALERVLVGLWAEVLGRETVGPDDDFFALGGHSILATQLFARITDQLQTRIPLRALFEHPTAASLAAHLTREPAEGARIRRTAELLLEVQEMSDEEAESALEDDRG